jgi:hypothetical protein
MKHKDTLCFGREFLFGKILRAFSNFPCHPTENENMGDVKEIPVKRSADPFGFKQGIYL